MRAASTSFLASLLALSVAVGSASAQPSTNADDVSAGHHLAVEICSICHLAAADQPRAPILKPPGPPLAAFVQGKDVTAASLTNFIKTTHRGLDEPNGMPNPDLADYQIKQVVAYLLSLRK